MAVAFHCVRFPSTFLAPEKGLGTCSSLFLLAWNYSTSRPPGLVFIHSCRSNCLLKKNMVPIDFCGNGELLLYFSFSCSSAFWLHILGTKGVLKPAPTSPCASLVLQHLWTKCSIPARGANAQILSVSHTHKKVLINIFARYGSCAYRHD